VNKTQQNQKQNKTKLNIKLIKPKSTKSKSKSLQSKISSFSGTDYIAQIKLVPEKGLTNGINLALKMDISPSSFTNTRLELISNTFQQYRFTSFSASFKTMLPMSVNSQFIAYIDTDPLDNPKSPSNGDDLLKLASAHQSSVTGSVMKNWSVPMIHRKQDTMYYIGDQGDIRFRKMGTLYIYQIGIPTKFDGSPITTILSAGTIHINWSIIFQSPQLTVLERITNPTSAAFIIESNYRPKDYIYSVANTVQGNAIGASVFRFRSVRLGSSNFSDGPGSYIIRRLPNTFNVFTCQRSLLTFAFPYSFLNYADSTKLDYLYLNSIIAGGDITTFLNTAFSLNKRPTTNLTNYYEPNNSYDVIYSQFMSYAVGAGFGTAVTLNSTNASDNTKSLPYGQCIITWDGSHPPLLQELLEFNTVDNALADVTVNPFAQYSISKIKFTDSTDIVEPRIPFLI